MFRMKMEKNELRASRDSQGFYEVTLHGVIVWDGFADSSKEAKENAISENEPYCTEYFEL